MGLSGSDCVPWSDSLEDPIPGMTTLRDAASYIQKLPKAEQRLPHWQNRRRDADPCGRDRRRLAHMARIAMLRAMNHGKEGVFRTDRKKRIGANES